MAIVIVLNAEQAAQVAGQNDHGTAIDPRRMLDGSFAISAAVLADPTHEAHHPLLATLPQRDVGPGDFPAPDEEA